MNGKISWKRMIELLTQGGADASCVSRAIAYMEAEERTDDERRAFIADLKADAKAAVTAFNKKE